MKRLFFAFVIASIAFLYSCGFNPKPGTVFLVTKDLPGSNNKYYAEQMHDIISKKKYDEGMRMYYLGQAIRVPEGEKITILETDGDYIKFGYISTAYWCHKKYIDQSVKK